MRHIKSARRGVAFVAVAAATTLVAAGCSAGSLGSSSGGGGSGRAVRRSPICGGNDDPTGQSANAIIEAFKAANPGHHGQAGHPPRRAPTATTWSRPSSPPATWPTSSSTTTAPCCRRSSPSRISTPLDDQPWAAVDLQKFVTRSTRADGKLYGGPDTGPPSAAGCSTTSRSTRSWACRCRRPGTSSWPTTTRSRRPAGSPRSRRPTATPGPRSCRSSADYANVEAAVPDFAAQYTAGKAKYATTPAALAGLPAHPGRCKRRGYFNKDFASAKFNDGLKDIASGKAAHYPQIGAVDDRASSHCPTGQDERRRVLRLARDRTRPSNGLTVWSSGRRVYIPKTVEGDEARRGEEVHRVRRRPSRAVTPSPRVRRRPGPFMHQACTAADRRHHGRQGHPGLLRLGQGQPGAGVQVADQGPEPGADLHPGRHRSGRPARRAPRCTTQDVKKQAQQLGLPGW